MGLLAQLLEMLGVLRTVTSCSVPGVAGGVKSRKWLSPVQRNRHDRVRRGQGRVEMSAHGGPWKGELPEAFTTSLLVWDAMPAEHGPSLWIGIADESFRGSGVKGDFSR